MNILGAGLSGLIAGALNARASIYERNDSGFVSHRAILRFRDDKIARALGLDFRAVTVRKSIWLDGGEVRPSPRVANLYSRKVRGVISDASIWNIEPVTRYIAPPDLHAILAGICGNRVEWNYAIAAPDLHELLKSGPLISTIPIPLLLDLLSVRVPIAFKYSGIMVDRYTIPNCDVFQTVYFPSPDSSVYRATLTGDLLTVESATGMEPFAELIDVCDALGLSNAMTRNEASHKQSFGKITPVNDAERKALLHRLTRDHSIYSLGRFATWRNILLDDVFDDVFHIRKMITLQTYDAALERTR